MSADSSEGAPETELKFKLGEGAITALAKHPRLSKPGRKKRLRSVYFDTPEHDLRNSGFSLRVREDDGRFVQTVKRSGEPTAFKRDEWEFLVEEVKVDLAALAKTPAGALLNGGSKRLAPMFETRIDRTISLFDDGKSIVEVAFDRGEVIAGGRRAPVREMELELRSGDPAVLFDLAGQLAEQAPMRLSFETKAERGYRLSGHDGAATIKAERMAMTPDTCVEAAFRQIARAALSQVSANAGLLASSRSPQVLHQTRVGLRRLRAALTAFKPVLDDRGRRRVKEELAALASELDSAREIDVFLVSQLELTGEELGDDPNVAALQQRAMQGQAEAYNQVAEMFASPRFSALLLELAEFIEVGGWSKRRAAVDLAQAPIGPFAAKVLDGLRRRVKKLGRGFDDLDAAGRHQLRLKVKTLRYSAEFFAGAARGGAGRKKKFILAAKTLQDRLGELNDLAVARETALRVVGPRASALAYTAGNLVALDQRREPDLLRRTARSLKALKKAETFWR